MSTLSLARTSFNGSRSPSPHPHTQHHQRPPFIHLNTQVAPMKLEPTSVYPEDERPSPSPSSSTPSPHRGLYGHRRTPSALGETMIATRSRSAMLKERLFASEGLVGRCLFLGWIVTSLGFLVALALWHGEVFATLDQLSRNLLEMGYEGRFIFGFLIFITTIPPVPLYSSLIVLSGYTFGVWEGFMISYTASLTGAIIVFVISRTLLRDVITKCLQHSPMAISLLQIIPQNPHLLLLIRIAPYPYNLLNVILASSPSLTLKTYTSCTALSLFKLLLHTWIGSGIHDISEELSHTHASEEEVRRHQVKTYSTWAGIVLCIGLFFYLTSLARKAVKQAQLEQLEEDHGRERRAEPVFLSPGRIEV